MLTGRGRSWAARVDNEGFDCLPPGGKDAFDKLAGENALESNPAVWCGSDGGTAPLEAPEVALAATAVV